MDYEWIELRFMVGNEVTFKKRFKKNSHEDKKLFFSLLRDKFDWVDEKVKKGENWWQ